MSRSASKFVVATSQILRPRGVIIEKDDVGIIESSIKNGSSVLFIRAGKRVRLNNNDFRRFDVKKAGDAFSKKICNICHKLLDTDRFDKNQNGKNNRTVRRPSCEECRKTLDGMKMSTKTKAAWTKNNPLPQYVPFECPICLKRTIAGVTSKVVLDHDHRTGEPRGWVCDSCNTGIGRFKDNVELIKRAIKFVE